MGNSLPVLGGRIVAEVIRQGVYPETARRTRTPPALSAGASTGLVGLRSKTSLGISDRDNLGSAFVPCLHTREPPRPSRGFYCISFSSVRYQPHSFGTPPA